MPIARFTVLLLPQVGVAMAYLRFHLVAFASLGPAAASMRYGLLTDTIVIIVVGLLTLTVNGLIAAALLKTAVKLEERSAGRRRGMATSFPEP